MAEFAAAVELFPNEADYILLDFDEADGSELLDEEAYYAAYAAFYEENPDIWMTTDALFAEAEAAYAEENPDGDIDAWMQDNGFWEAVEKFYWVVPTPDAVAEVVAQYEEVEEIELEFTEEEEAPVLYALEGTTWPAASITQDQTVTLTGDVTVTGVITINSGATLTIKGGYTIYRGANFAGIMFEIMDGGKLIIENDDSSGTVTTIDGNASWSKTPVENSTRWKATLASGTKTTNGAIYCKPGSEVFLENVVMQNLYCPVGSSGGAALRTERVKETTNYSKITMNNVTIQNCLDLSGNSVVLLDDSVAEITNCKFIGNYAGQSYSGVIKGSGTRYCVLTMTGCEARENYSSGWGGFMLWASNVDDSEAMLNGCIFEDNIARYLGGAISNEATMYISNCTINDNIAMAGGGIATFPFTLTKEGDAGRNACGLHLLSGNIIEDNKAIANGDFTPFLYQDVNEEGTIGRDSNKNGTIENNENVKTYNSDSVIADDVAIDTPITYPGGGGGIWCYMNKAGWTCSLEIGSGNTIQNNEAENMGGGVYVHHVAGTATELSITGAYIIENTAVDGGGVAVYTAALKISGGIIDNNTAYRNGGGAYVYNGSCTIEGGTISDNNAVNGAGAYVDEGSCEISDGNIVNNTASGNGGGAYVDEGTCTIEGEGAVNYNKAKNGGGFYIEGDITVSGGYIIGNMALYEPTVEKINSTPIDHPEGNVTAYNSEDNLSGGVGGGIYLHSGSFKMPASNSVGMYGNKANFAADDIYASADTNVVLNIPDVNGMDLSGNSGEQGKVTGWYEDYVDADTYYESGYSLGEISGVAFKNNDPNVMRYRKATDNYKVLVEDKQYFNTDVSGKYICLTLGYQLDRLQLIVEKQVTGNMGDLNKKFDFTVTYYEDTNRTETKTFQLSDGETNTILNILYGTEVIVTETSVEGYETTVQYWGENTPTQTNSVNDNEVVVDGIADNMHFIFTNDKTVVIDTAVHLDYLPYILILTAVIPTMALAVSRKRRRRED